jgi:uncharacterized membrane protein
MARPGLRKVFAAGALLVMPLLVTWFLISFVFDKVNANVTPLLTTLFKTGARWVPQLDPAQPWLKHLIPLLGLALVLGMVFVVGFMGSNFLGKKVIHRAEEAILRVPLVKGIYGSAKQLFDAFNMPGRRAFDRVVLIQYPRVGLYTLAFVTREVGSHVRERTGVPDLIYVFIPTTPNPTSGFLILVSESELIDTGMAVEQGLKTIVSGGMVPIPDVRAADARPSADGATVK